MEPIHESHEPTSAQLLTIIRMQTEIAKLGLDLNGVMTLVTEQARAITKASGAVVELAEGDEMVYRAVAGTASSLLGLRLLRSASLSGLCVALAQPLRSDDTDDDPRVDREACRRVGIRSMVVMPLIHEKSAVGVLKVYSPHVAAFSQADIQTLHLMADLIAASLYHAAKYGADELFRQATTDLLTGLPNRALFLDRLRQALARSHREDRPLAILMIDMDGLKPVNDHHGHQAGDAAIREMGRRIQGGVRSSDTAARLGGDEFGVVLPQVDSRQDALATARRVSEQCNGIYQLGDQTLPLGASIGVAIYPHDGNELESLLESADRAMYCEKRTKKDTAL